MAACAPAGKFIANLSPAMRGWRRRRVCVILKPGADSKTDLAFGRGVVAGLPGGSAGHPACAVCAGPAGILLCRSRSPRRAHRPAFPAITTPPYSDCSDRCRSHARRAENVGRRRLVHIPLPLSATAPGSSLGVVPRPETAPAFSPVSRSVFAVSGAEMHQFFRSLLPRTSAEDTSVLNINRLRAE